MRLINATTVKLELFNDESTLPDYAILSHRWVDGEEVLFKDFQNLDPEVWNLFNSFVPDAQEYLRRRRNPHLQGWTKIEKCCQQALKDDLKYVWVDTCCIDKESSAELSEAINTMFRWYADARLCYAYLSDYSHDVATGWETEFAKSSWFERAWTLQELIAPTSVIFFDRSWNAIGSRSDLCEEIAEASGINHLELFTMKSPDLNNWSIAQRFSWASKRKATRTEDLAYSLLGIFDVNLPLLYGEGTKAFRRLQEAIVQQTSDQTIFAWSGSNDLTDLTSIFAPSAAAFRQDHFLSPKNFNDTSPMSLSNLGLTMNVRLQFWTRDIAWAGLNCTRNGFDQIGIFICRNSHTASVWNKCRVGGKFWHAIRMDGSVGESSNVTVITRLTLPLLERAWPVSQTLAMADKLPALYIPSTMWTGLQMVIGSKAECDSSDANLRIDSTMMQIKPTKRAKLRHRHNWSTSTYATVDAESFTPCGGSLVVVEYNHARCAVRALMLGFDSDLRPFCILAEPHHTGYKEGMEDTDILIDRSLSLHFKSFWQCSGLEEDGWIDWQDGLTQHPSDSMQPGLWALKGDRNNTSKFLLNLRNRKITFGFKLRHWYGHDKAINDKLYTVEMATE